MNEQARLKALQGLDLLDTPYEREYDDIVRVASAILSTPIALVSLVDSDRQWFKAQVGLDARETPRSMAFCAHAIQGNTTFVVENATQDDRFSTNPLVTSDPNIRFYAGRPLAFEGQHIGTLCVIDRTPRTLTAKDEAALDALGRQVEELLKLRALVRELDHERRTLAHTKRRLEESNQLLEQFVSIVTHDLRSPIRGMRAVAGWALEAIDEGDLDAARNELARLEQRGADADQMIVALYDFVRQTSVASDLNTVDIAAEANALLPELREQSGGRPVSLTVSNGLAQAPRAAVHHILRNLMSNAVLHHDGTAVCIDVGLDMLDSYYELTVADDGPGIPMNRRGRVFHPFTKSESSEGTGMGMAAVQRLAMALDGSVQLEDNRPRGTVVTVRWPVPEES